MSKSSLVRGIFYNYEAGSLVLSFYSGAYYEYYMVPEQTFIDFVNADSLGKYFNENIKDKFKFNEIEEFVS